MRGFSVLRCFRHYANIERKNESNISEVLFKYTSKARCHTYVCRNILYMFLVLLCTILSSMSKFYPTLEDKFIYDVPVKYIVRRWSCRCTHMMENEYLQKWQAGCPHGWPLLYWLAGWLAGWLGDWLNDSLFW